MTHDPTKSLGERFQDAFLESWGQERGIAFVALPPHSQARWNRAAVNFTASLSDAPKVGPEIRDALRLALSFMEGFEGDDMQEGIDERIDTVRSALKAAEGVG